MEIKIVDTTLRDGEQMAGIALGVNEKVQIATLLDRLPIYQIEAGIPAMGGGERKSIAKIAGLGLKSRISAWNRMNMNDIKQSIGCEVHLIHISVPASNIQIYSKLKKTKNWVIEEMKRCISFAREKGYTVTIGMEDASRAEFDFLMQLIGTAVELGVNRIRYADTVGILYRQRIFDEISYIKKQFTVDIEIHAHNDLGMAVANSVSAAKAGAEFVNCTIGGIGERTGNCDYLQFIQALEGCLGVFKEVDLTYVIEVQREIMGIIKAVKT